MRTMHKKILSLFALLIIALPMLGQGLKLQIGGGLAAHYKGTHVVGAYKGGIGYELEFNQRWTFTPSLNYIAKGMKLPDEVVPFYDPNGNLEYDDNGNVRTGVMSRQMSANYVQMPLMVSYYLRTAESQYVVFSAGPYVAYGVSGKVETKGDTSREGSEKMYYESPTFDQADVHRFDAGLQAMIGYQFPSSLTLGIEADFGITKFNATGRNVSGLISLSYRFGK